MSTRVVPFRNVKSTSTSISMSISMSMSMNLSMNLSSNRMSRVTVTDDKVPRYLSCPYCGISLLVRYLHIDLRW